MDRTFHSASARLLLTDDSAFRRQFTIGRVAIRRSSYALRVLQHRNLLTQAVTRRDVVLVVEKSKWHQVEAELNARSHHEIVEAHAGGSIRAVQVGRHLANVVRRGADVGEGENDREAPQADLLPCQPRSHHSYDQDQCGRLPNDEHGENDELDAHEVVSENHEVGGVQILISLLILLAFF